MKRAGRKSAAQTKASDAKLILLRVKALLLKLHLQKQLQLRLKILLKSITLRILKR